jgi:hypothetical protein
VRFEIRTIVGQLEIGETDELLPDSPPGAIRKSRSTSRFIEDVLESLSSSQAQRDRSSRSQSLDVAHGRLPSLALVLVSDRSNPKSSDSTFAYGNGSAWKAEPDLSSPNMSKEAEMLQDERRDSLCDPPAGLASLSQGSSTGDAELTMGGQGRSRRRDSFISVATPPQTLMSTCSTNTEGR